MSPPDGIVWSLLGDIHRFEDRYWGTRAVHFISAGTPVAGVFALADLEAQLGRGAIDADDIDLIKDQLHVPAESFRYPGPELRRSGLVSEMVRRREEFALRPLLADGYSIRVLDATKYSPEVQRWRNELTEVVGRAVQANLYTTPPAASTLPQHHDPHDALVVQLSGTKRWTVDAPVTIEGADDGAQRHVAAPNTPITLQPGERLYLPAGTVHSAVANDTVSMHLTFGFHRLNWRTSIVDDLFWRIGFDERFLVDVPLATSRHDHDATHRDLVNLAHDALEASIDREPWVDRPGLAERDEAIDLHLRLRRSEHEVDVAEFGDSVVVRTDHFATRFDIEWRPVVDGLLGGELHTVREAIARWGAVGREVARRLLDGGVLFAVDETRNDDQRSRDDASTNTREPAGPPDQHSSGTQLIRSFVHSTFIPTELDTERDVVRLVDVAGVEWTEKLADQTIGRVTRDVHRAVEVPFSDYLAAAGELADDPQPGLILMTSRCGSTLLANLLAAVTPTLPLKEQALVGGLLVAAIEAPYSRLGREAADALRTTGALTTTPDRPRGLWKLPQQTTVQAPLLARVFPDAPIVFLFRDPVDTVASRVSRPAPREEHLRGEQYRPTLVQRVIDEWLDVVDAALNLPAERTHFVAYHELCADPQATTAAAARHLGLGSGTWTSAAQTMIDRHAYRPDEPFRPVNRRAELGDELCDLVRRRTSRRWAELGSRADTGDERHEEH
ncbi:MAG: cupin domain-containing protein [Actinomycetota bacterium]